MIAILPRMAAGIGLLLFFMPVFESHALQDGHQSLGQAADWHAYTYLSSGGKKVCALSSQPVVMTPKADPQRKAFFIITRHNPEKGGKARNEIAIDAGQALAPDGQIMMIIAERKFMMLAGASRSGFEAQWAWPFNISDEPRIISLMKAQYNMEISAELENGEKILDRYSLKGVTGGLALLVKNCP